MRKRFSHMPAITSEAARQARATGKRPGKPARKSGRTSPPAVNVQKARQRLSADALVKAYQEDTDRKRAMVRRTEATRNRLLFITEALRRLSRDERFLALLEDEDLATMPENIASRLRLDEAPRQ